MWAIHIPWSFSMRQVLHGGSFIITFFLLLLLASLKWMYIILCYGCCMDWTWIQTGAWKSVSRILLHSLVDVGFGLCCCLLLTWWILHLISLSGVFVSSICCSVFSSVLVCSMALYCVNLISSCNVMKGCSGETDMSFSI